MNNFFTFSGIPRREQSEKETIKHPSVELL